MQWQLVLASLRRLGLGESQSDCRDRARSYKVPGEQSLTVESDKSSQAEVAEEQSHQALGERL